MTFEFRLRSVLKVRQEARNLERHAVEVARSLHRNAVAKRNQVASDRAELLDEIRRIHGGETWEAREVVQRRRHAETLGELLQSAEQAIAESLVQLELCLKRLIAADQSAKAIERLSERKLAEYRRQKASEESKESDDATSFRYRAA